MTRANSHYNVWVACVLYLRELLLATGEVTAERLQAVYVLSRLWQLLPVNRLRQIRARLLRASAAR